MRDTSGYLLDELRESRDSSYTIQEIFSQRYGIMIRYLWLRIYSHTASIGLLFNPAGGKYCIDNLTCVNPSFKYEEAYLTQYNNIKEARTAIGQYIHTYNFERRHSALDYQTPAECYYPAMLLPYVA